MSLKKIIDDTGVKKAYIRNGDIKKENNIFDKIKNLNPFNDQPDIIYSNDPIESKNSIKRYYNDNEVHYKKKSTLEGLIEYNELSYENKSDNKYGYKLKTQLDLLKKYYENSVSDIDLSNHTDVLKRFYHLNTWKSRVEYINLLKDSIPEKLISDMYVIIMSNNYVKKKILDNESIYSNLENIKDSINFYQHELKNYNTLEIVNYFKNRIKHNSNDLNIDDLELEYKKGYNWSNYFKEIDNLEIDFNEKRLLFSILGDNSSLEGYYNGIKKKVDQIISKEGSLEELIEEFECLKEKEDMSNLMEDYLKDLISYHIDGFDNEYSENKVKKYFSSLKNNFKNKLKSLSNVKKINPIKKLKSIYDNKNKSNLSKKYKSTNSIENNNEKNNLSNNLSSDKSNILNEEIKKDNYVSDKISKEKSTSYNYESENISYNDDKYNSINTNHTYEDLMLRFGIDRGIDYDELESILELELSF